VDEVAKEKRKRKKQGKENSKKKTKSKPQKFKSIKRTFVWYLPLCVLTAYLGAYGIGLVTNELQYWYEVNYSDADSSYQERLKEAYFKSDELQGGEPESEFGGLPEAIQIDNEGNIIEAGDVQSGETYIRIEFSRTINGITYYDVRSVGELFTDNPWHRFVYGVISYGQSVLMVGWVLLCVFVTGILFYKRELEKPISVLMDASGKISENCLDFEMKPVKHNELGKLCRSFEDMRQALYENNRELWRALEERKRLNAAFSHDIRTPLAVLKGYQEMLRNYVPEGKFSENQLLDMIQTMGSQIERLENYTQKMSAVQKLEDIVPARSAVMLGELAEQCRESGKLLAGELDFEFCVKGFITGVSVTRAAKLAEQEQVLLDKEFFLEVFENMVFNAAPFAKSRLRVTLEPVENENTTKLLLIVEDDGPGFLAEALQKATEPFYGSEKDGKVHFGLGLYICKTICEKHGGALLLENKTEEEKCPGSRVTASFGVDSLPETV